MGALATLRDLPLLCVTPAGLSPAAAYMAMLHERYTGRPSRHLSTVEAVLASSIRDAGVVLLSGSGSEPDVLQACEDTAWREPRMAMVLVATSGSPVARLAAANTWMTLVETPMAADLATDSPRGLPLAVCVLLYRAYMRRFSLPERLPGRLSELVGGGAPGEARPAANTAAFRRKAAVRASWYVVHGGWATPAALALGADLSAGAIAEAQPVDHATFAADHARRGPQRLRGSAVVSLATAEAEAAAAWSLEALPKEVPVVRGASSRPGPEGAVELVAWALDFAATAAESGPGRPHGDTTPGAAWSPGPLPTSLARERHRRPRRELLLERKLGAPLARWPEAAVSATAARLDAYLTQLAAQRFHAVILDFDGTLYHGREPRPRLTPPVALALERLLRGGATVGVATGRGRLLRDPLRASLDAALWDRVVVGYCNGSEVIPLGEAWPDSPVASPPELLDLLALLQGHPQVPALAGIELRGAQVTLEPFEAASAQLVHRLATEIVYGRGARGITVARSKYSVDIVAEGVSKLRVYEFVARELLARTGTPRILCIGDSGTWEGNDLRLLSSPFSLSADESPMDASHCWNIAPLGHRGVQATLDYLNALRPEKGGFALDVERLAGGWPGDAPRPGDGGRVLP